MAAAVPSEDGPVQMALGALPAQPVVNAHGPAPEVGEHPVDPPQDPVGRTVADHPALPRVVRQPGVSAPPVGDGPGARRDRPGDEAVERRPAIAVHPFQPDAAWFPVLRQFHRTGDGDPVRRAAAPAGHGRPVHLRGPGQRAAVRVHHRPPQLPGSSQADL